MKIKLTRALWNHQEGEVIDENIHLAEWAIRKGYAVEVKDENKAIVPEYVKESKRGRKPKK